MNQAFEKKSAKKKTPEERLEDAVSEFRRLVKDGLHTGIAGTARLEISMNSGGITRAKLGFERSI